MKTAVVVDFDTRRVLFQKIVEALRLFPSMENWDLSWGEPYLAVTKDRRIWVRVFYEESMPSSVEKLKGEVERLAPHLKSGGEMILCLPQGCDLDLQEVFSVQSVPVRLWSYSGIAHGVVAVREVEKNTSLKGPPIVINPTVDSERFVASGQTDQRLSSAEVRQLAEMGLELKRFNLKQAS